MLAAIRKNITRFSPKTYWREILSVMMLLLAVLFFRGERKELASIVPHIRQSSPQWFIAGLAVTAIFLALQGGMYKKSFSAIGLSLPLMSAIGLFLKRNFLSLFLPAGGVSSLAYTPQELRKTGFSKTAIHQASGLFAFAGLVTVLIAGLPVILYAIEGPGQFQHAWTGLLILAGITTSAIVLARSLKYKGKVYRLLEKRIPAAIPFIDELFSANVNAGKVRGAILCSIGVELCGMLHMCIAMLALGLPASFGAAAVAYILSVLLMIVSPFLRGLGAVELSLVYVLGLYGYSPAHALAITILYRVFEFWVPLMVGLFTFLWKGRKLFLRVAPALLIFLLGMINIISVVTPPLHYRMRLIREYLPLSAIHASNFLVLFTGLVLLIVSAYLLKGLRSAWILAMALASLSLFGHLFKALDYEESCFATLTILALLMTYKQYTIRSSRKWVQVGFITTLLTFAAVLLFGFISFYFIDKKHFGVDFTWQQSLIHTLKSYLLVQDDTLHPVTAFGTEFIILIRILGFLSWGFALFTFIKPYLHATQSQEPAREKAQFLLNQYGNSPVDYFKTYKDKLIFFSDIHDSFVAYRIANGFAIVLEEPVCAEENKLDVLKEFDIHCRKMGLKTAFYRVDENSIPWFNQLKKNKLMIGQEAILEVNSFSLEGKDKKSLRNSLNSLQKKGYTATIHKAPVPDELMGQLKAVSDEWLKSFNKQEMIFSQGMFDSKELKKQDIITLTDADNNIRAFLNIIPDFSPEECTYDLIRKTSGAGNGYMDALIIKLVEYARQHEYAYINLGMVPMTGIGQPGNTAEQLMKFALSKLKRFQHYKGLREFKEKYATIWENKYLVYENDFDLLQLPVALNTVMKP